jgi:hypothetical protein
VARRIGRGGPFLVEAPRNDTQPNNIGPQGGRGPRTIVLPPPRRWLVLWPDDEFAPATVAATLEEDTFVSGVRAGALPPARAAFAEPAEEWIASIPVDDDYSYVGAYRGYAPARAFVGDDDAWMASIAVDDDFSDAGKYRGYAPGRAFVGDDDAWIASIAVDDDFSDAGKFRAFAQTWVVAIDDDVPISSIALDDDFSDAGKYRGYPPGRIFIGDDDAWMASIGVDDEAPELRRISAQIWMPAVLLEEEDLPPQAAAFGPDEDGWSGPLFVLKSAPRPFIGEEDLAPAISALEDDPWSLALPQSLRAPAGIFSADEDGAPSFIEDDGWWIIVPPRAHRARLVLHDAEILAIAAGLSSDPRYIVHLAARGFSKMLGGRAFDAIAAARGFKTSAPARIFGTAEGSRKFVVTWKNPRT